MSSIRSWICVWLRHALLVFRSLTTSVLCLWSAWRTVWFLQFLVTPVSRTMGNWQQNTKSVQKKVKSRRAAYKAGSVIPKAVCNHHGELEVLWDFICFIVMFKRSQIMWLRGKMAEEIFWWLYKNLSCSSFSYLNYPLSLLLFGVYCRDGSTFCELRTTA